MVMYLGVEFIRECGLKTRIYLDSISTKMATKTMEVDESV